MTNEVVLNIVLPKIIFSV